MQNISFKQMGLALALSIIHTFVLGQTAEPLQITWPAERSVFQRNGNGTGGNATISIAGQFTGDKLLDASVYRYRFVKLDPQNGITEINVGSWNNLTKNDFGLASAKITTFMNSNILDAGWYRLDVELRKSFLGWVGKRIAYATRKFGVGDVYIIAGQSNARGFEPEFDAGLIPYDNSLTESSLPDAVSVLNRLAHGQNNTFSVINFGQENWKYEQIGGIPFQTKFSKYKLLSEGKYPYIYNTSNPSFYLHTQPVYPMGSQSWYWSALGKKLISESIAPKVPVMFFNAAVDGSSAGSWTWKSPYVVLPNFLGLRSTLTMFGNLLGVRSILWHQGESDKVNSTTSVDYQTNINSLIDDMRNGFNQNLQWYVSNTSYWGKYSPATSPDVISGQNGVINSGRANRGVYTDNIDWTNGKRATGEKVHFSGSSHATIANRWFDPKLDNTEYPTGQTVKRIWEHDKPISAQPLQQLNNIVYSGGNYTLTAPNGFFEYKWVENDKGIFTATNNNSQSITINESQNGGKYYICYMRSYASFNNTVATRPFYIFSSPDIQMSLSVSTPNLTFNATDSPKNFNVISSNILWGSSDDQGWLDLGPVDNVAGGSGTTPIAVTVQQNTSTAARTATITIQGDEPNTTRTINVTQNGTGSSCSPTNLSSVAYSGGSSACCGGPKNNLSIDNHILTIGGQTWTNGVGVHANSTITYNFTAGQYSAFQSYIGRDDEADFCNCPAGSGQTIIFKVQFNTGLGSFTSAPKGIASPAELITIPIPANATQIQLIVEDGGDNYWGDHADWADAKFLCSGTPPPPPPNCTNVYLTNNWTSQYQECCGGTPQIGHNYSGGNLNINGTNYTAQNPNIGIGTHSQSEIVYDFASNHPYLNFKAEVGRDLGSYSCGCGNMDMVFKVLNGNTNQVIGGPITMGNNQNAQTITAPITGVSKIKLVVERGSDNQNWGDWADWANARLTCANNNIREATNAESQTIPEETIDGLAIFPNPTNDKLTTKFSLTEASKVSFEIIDMQGRNLENYNYKGEAGLHTFIIDVSKYNAGNYILRSMLGTKLEIKKFAVEK